jgi:hypothetical protein
VGSALVTVLVLTVIYGLWIAPDADWYARLVGVEGVLVAALTLLVPVLSRFTGPGPQEAEPIGSPPGLATIRFCPSCGRPVVPGSSETASAAVCDGCGLTFEVIVRSDGDPSSIPGLPVRSPTTDSA